MAGALRVHGEASDGEREDEGRLHHCAYKLQNAKWWGRLVMCMIALNTCSMAIQCDYPDWNYWFIVEIAFLSFFIVEMSVRLYVFRCSFFTDENERQWNIFELTVVLAGVIQCPLEHLMPNTDSPEADAFFSILRILRIFRTCRLTKYFKQLYLLVLGFVHSLQAVFWIGVLFFLIVLIAGIVCTTVVGQNADLWAEGPDVQAEDEKLIKLYFGSLVKSMITMFQIVTLDDWAKVVKLVNKRMPSMTVFFIGYILITAFAMIALLTGVITDNVNDVGKESEKEEDDKKFKASVLTLEQVFQQSGNEQSGGLSLVELTRLLHDNREILDRIESGQINIHTDDIADIFRCMDVSGDNRVDWKEFRQGMKYIRGPATAKQVALLRSDVCALSMKLAEAVRAAPRRAASASARGAGDAAAISRLGRLDERLRLMDITIKSLVQAIDKGHRCHLKNPGDE